MVAKIVIGKSIRGILHYNESKVAEGKAQLIMASGFAGEIDRMDIFQKYQRFKYLNELRPTVKTNALHITLNFDASEKIDDSKMQKIANAYMEGIGFSEQPFLVYRHNDVAHQHIHIATTSIQRNGERIDLHNIAIDHSEPTRKQIEKDFELIVAEKKPGFKRQPTVEPVDPQKVTYGHIPTKRAISNILSEVVNNYKYTSLAELNAALRQFSIIADRGKEDTDMFKNKGLIYFMLDKGGNKIGVPIKASTFHSKPTLRNLEKRFDKNTEKRKAHKQALVKRIDGILLRYQQLTKATLVNELQKVGVAIVFRRNDKGLVYGVTFVDHHHKTVFNGSDLGKAYSAKSLIEKLGGEDKAKTYLTTTKEGQTYLKPLPETGSFLYKSDNTRFLDELIAGRPDEYLPLPKKQRKKKRKGKQPEQDLGYSL